MQIAIYSRFLKQAHVAVAQCLIDTLEAVGAQIYIAQEYYQSFQGRIKHKPIAGIFAQYEDFKTLDIDFFITLGGDGTILDAVTIVRDTKVPVMGINLGRLGFLAMIQKENIASAIHALLHNAFVLDNRTLLYLEYPLDHMFGTARFALNDFTIVKRDTSSMVILHTYVNGEFLNSYWADGIIVSTPTGSTGYSLSCGGPIIFPKSDNFVITPVAPHNLNVRPIVLSDDVVISFEIEGRAKNFLCTLDSRYATITADYPLAVRKADFSIDLVRLSDHSFLQTIREKLNWGIDSRN